MARRPKVQTLSKPGQIAVLSSPVRHVILDALTAAAGPCSVSRIAALVGRPADSLYYHLRALCRAGLIRRSSGSSGGRRGMALYEVPSEGIKIRYDFRSATFRRNIVRMVSAMLRATDRDFAKSVLHSEARGSGKNRDTWAGRVELRLTRDQLESLNRRIDELLELQYEGSESPSAGRFAMTIALARMPDRRHSADEKRRERAARTLPRIP